jgi:hypothetical protein
MPVKTGLQKPEWSQNTRDRLGRLVMGVGLALLLAFPIRAWLARRMVRNLPAGPPTDLYRIRSAAMTGLLHAWLPSMAALAIYLSLVTGDGLTPDAAELASDALLAVVLGVIVVSIARAALRPNRSLLRLAPLSDAGARRVYWVVVGLAWLFAVHFVLSSSHKSRDVSLEVIAPDRIAGFQQSGRAGVVGAALSSSLDKTRGTAADCHEARATLFAGCAHHRHSGFRDDRLCGAVASSGDSRRLDHGPVRLAGPADAHQR